MADNQKTAWLSNGGQCKADSSTAGERQVVIHDLGIGRGSAFQADMQFRRPLAFNLLA